MIIYLAGLQNIPSMYKEAARLDGANRVKEFFYVTLPLLIPSITTAVVTNLIGGFKLFDAIVAMSGGGPNRNPCPFRSTFRSCISMMKKRAMRLQSVS